MDLYKYDGSLTWRELWSLVTQLPPESATATILRLQRRDEPAQMPEAAHDYESEQWSRVEHLLAAVRDELHYLRYAFTQANAGKTRIKWKPEPLPRPGIAPKRKREVLVEPQVEMLWAHLQKTQGPN